MEIKAVAKNIRISPRKIRLVAGVFKKTKASDAIVRLNHAEMKAARLLSTVIKSALSNAKNANLAVDSVVIKNIIVNQGMAFKRFRPVSRGSAHGYKRRTSTVTVVLEG